MFNCSTCLLNDIDEQRDPPSPQECRAEDL